MSKRKDAALRNEVARVISEHFSDLPPDLFDQDEEAFEVADAVLKVVADYFSGPGIIKELQRLSGKSG